MFEDQFCHRINFAGAFTGALYSGHLECLSPCPYQDSFSFLLSLMVQVHFEKKLFLEICMERLRSVYLFLLILMYASKLQ